MSALPTLTETSVAQVPTATSGATASPGSSASGGSSNTATSAGSSNTPSPTNSSGTATNTASSAATPSNLPNLSSGSSDSSSSSGNGAAPITTGLPNIPQLSALPTLPGGYSYPAPTVPPMANAPYLNTSHLPQDFVFIVVGATLAFITLLILAWRIATTYMTNRSVKHSSKNNTPYSYLGLDHKSRSQFESMHDLKDLGVATKRDPSSLSKGGTGSRVNSYVGGQGPMMRETSSLFFSPTAAAANAARGGSSHGLPNSGGYAAPQRASTYLSSGYYGVGQAAQQPQHY